MKKNILKKLLVFILISVWFYTGWPVIWHNPRIPPKIKEVRADTATYYFNSWNDKDSWDDTNPAEMVDGSTSTFSADNNTGHYVHLNTNEYSSGGSGTITAVEVRAFIKNNWTSLQTTRTCVISMTPYFGGSTAGSAYGPSAQGWATAAWTSYYNITSDANGPGTWSWTDVANLDMRVITVRPASGQVNVYRVEIRVTYTPDTSPPTPDPMTFASAPANDSASQISMISTTGSDATLPVNYLFTNDNSGCGANAGTGGTSSSWQSNTSYSDSGLQPNQCYGYTVQARDSVATPNTGTASSVSSIYTSANTPGTPTLTNPTLTTLRLTNDNNANPTTNPTTYFAVQVVTTSPNDSTWINQWVDASGNPSATAVWQTDAALDALTLTGLDYGTTYGVKVKAKNEDGDETPLSAEGQGTTTAAIISVSITANSTIAYGMLVLGTSKSTIDLGTSSVAQNDGNIPEDFTIKTSNASTGIGWTVGSAPGTNIFVYESSPNGGSTWTKFTTADSYQSFVPAVTNVGVGATQRFDLRLTAPTLSDGVTKNITVTVLATQH